MITKPIRNFLRKNKYTSAVILAGGSSTRMGGTTTKQFMMLEGKPVIVHTLLAFENCRNIDEIIIVARRDEITLYKSIVLDFGLSKVVKVVSGGSTRQESALHGVDSVCEKCRYVVFHDGARPLVTPEIISNVVCTAYEERAASAGTVSKDTVKLADNNLFVETTLNRDRVWLIQTPQAFYKPMYEATAYSALKENFEVTDDASLVEHYYYKVKLVDCGNENIKITTPSDLLTAASILKKRNSVQ